MLVIGLTIPGIQVYRRLLFALFWFLHEMWTFPSGDVVLAAHYSFLLYDCSDIDDSFLSVTIDMIPKRHHQTDSCVLKTGYPLASQTVSPQNGVFSFPSFASSNVAMENS